MVCSCVAVELRVGKDVMPGVIGDLDWLLHPRISFHVSDGSTVLWNGAQDPLQDLRQVCQKK